MARQRRQTRVAMMARERRQARARAGLDAAWSEIPGCSDVRQIIENPNLIAEVVKS